MRFDLCQTHQWVLALILFQENIYVNEIVIEVKTVFIYHKHNIFKTWLKTIC